MFRRPYIDHLLTDLDQHLLQNQTVVVIGLGCIRLCKSIGIGDEQVTTGLIDRTTHEEGIHILLPLLLRPLWRRYHPRYRHLLMSFPAVAPA